MCACCRLLFEDGFSGTYFISLSISYFSDNYCQMTWHRTTMQAGKGGETGIFINIYFHRKLQFFSFRSPLPALFIVARPKNKSSLLPRIFGGLSFVNLVNPPSKHCLIMSLKLFQNIDMCFPPSQRFSGVHPAHSKWETSGAQNHLSEDWHWSFSTGSSEYWFGFNQSSAWGNMTHTQTLMMLSPSIYFVLITFGAESRFVLCYRTPGPQNLRIELCWDLRSSAAFPWWQNRNPLPLGVRRLAMVRGCAETGDFELFAF